MTKPQTFLLDQLAAVVPGSVIDQSLFARRDLRQDVQDGYDRLFRPAPAGDCTLIERLAVAAFVAALHGEPGSSGHFDALLRQEDRSSGRVSRVVVAQAQAASRLGPYGPPLGGSARSGDLDGPVYAASADVREVLGDRLAAALEFAHLMYLHPADANVGTGVALRKAGWTDEGADTLALVVAFLGQQLRLVAGLRAVSTARAEAKATPSGTAIVRNRAPVRPTRVAPTGVAWFQYGC